LQLSPALLLTLGTAAGIIAAAVGLLSSGRSTSRALSDDAVARVNGQIIRSDDYQRLLNAVQQDRRDPVSAAQRRQLLDRLIDEELLVQRGLELGLARQDPRVRKDLTAAVIDSIVTDTETLQPTDAELQAFYDAHREFFSAADRLRLRQIWCKVATSTDATGALVRAQQAVKRLRAGEDFEAVRGAVGDRELAPLPDALLPLNKLADYLGPTALRRAQALAVGGVSEPVRSGSGYHVLQLLDRQSGGTQSFEAVKPQVIAELRREAGDRAMRAYLDDLRNRADVVVSPELP